MNQLGRETRAVIKKGSKTFALASLIFDRKSREGAQLLYTWCRACDDAVDNEPDVEKARAKLMELSVATHLVFNNSLAPSESMIPIGEDLTFQAFALLSRRHGIEEAHAQALLDGMAMDVEGAHIQTDDDLKLYCYRVAGVVGLMMSKVMGVTDSRAHRHAVDMGLAMQMTNIARDVREDFERRRIYLPDSWFVEHKRPSFDSPFRPEFFAPHIKRLVRQAEVLYESGTSGLTYLPFRAAFAVACAQAFYREIGRKVLSRGKRAWDTRTVVSLPRKLSLVVGAFARVGASRFARLTTDQSANQPS